MKVDNKKDILTDMEVEIDMYDICIAENKKKRRLIIASAILHLIFILFLMQFNLKLGQICMPLYIILLITIMSDNEYFNTVESIITHNKRRNEILCQLKNFKKEKNIK